MESPVLDYRLFGGLLRSELEFPRLPAVAPDASEAVDWTLRVANGPAPVPAGVPLGEDEVTPDVRVRLYRPDDGEGFLLAFDDTGVFRISADGTEIDWVGREGADVDDVRLDLLGRVLPFALHRQGFFVLHASAVVSGGAAIALVGPKGYGKSTLAHALVRNGAMLLTDDALPLSTAGAPVAVSGVRRLRLRDDVAEAAPTVDRPVAHRRGRTEIGFEEDAGALHDRLPVPVDRIYLLDPRPREERRRPVVRSEDISGPRATAILVSQAKLGPLLEPWSPGELLRAAASVVRQVPVHRLQLARDLSRLDEAARYVLTGGDEFPTGDRP